MQIHERVNAMDRVRGVIVNTEAEKAGMLGQVLVTDHCNWKGRQLPIISINNDVFIVDAIEVDFFIVSAMVDGKSEPVAVNVRPILVDEQQLSFVSEELSNEVASRIRSEKKQKSILQSVIKRLDEDDANRSYGQGGSRHRYIQSFIKQLAEKLGWHASVEKQLADGVGATDVLLDYHGITVACEVVVSTVYTEHRNLRKNILAGYTHIVSVADNTQKIEAVKRTVERKLGKDYSNKITYLLPEQVYSLLSDIMKKHAESLTREDLVRGYKVKVRFIPLNEEETRRRTELVCRIVANSMLSKPTTNASV